MKRISETGITIRKCLMREYIIIIIISHERWSNEIKWCLYNNNNNHYWDIGMDRIFLSHPIYIIIIIFNVSIVCYLLSNYIPKISKQTFWFHHCQLLNGIFSVLKIPIVFIFYRENWKFCLFTWIWIKSNRFYSIYSLTMDGWINSCVHIVTIQIDIDDENFFPSL